MFQGTFISLSQILNPPSICTSSFISDITWSFCQTATKVRKLKHEDAQWRSLTKLYNLFCSKFTQCILFPLVLWKIFLPTRALWGINIFGVWQIVSCLLFVRHRNIIFLYKLVTKINIIFCNKSIYKIKTLPHSSSNRIFKNNALLA